MSAPKLILFNGPRHSGKDTAALFCESKFNAFHFKMSGPIKAAIKAAFSLSDEEVDHLETIKTEPSFLLYGLSYVQVQISFSEEWAKKVFGPFIFGNLASRAVRTNLKADPDQKLYVCSDSGFALEAMPVLDIIGKENALLVRIKRDGKTFAGDSRSYIELPGVKMIELENNGTTEDYHKVVEKAVKDFAFT